MKRTLTIRRETLTVLGTDELALVGAGAHPTFPECQVEMAELIVALLLSPLPTRPCS